MTPLVLLVEVAYLMLDLELEWFEPLVSMKMDDNNDCTFRLAVGGIHFGGMIAVVGNDALDMSLRSC